MNLSLASVRGLVLLIASLTIDLSDSARILGVFPHFGKSHFDFFEPLMKVLAERGHQIVVISHFPQTKPIANYTDINIRSSFPSLASPVSFVSQTTAKLVRRFGNGPALSGMGTFVCFYALGSSEIQAFISSDQKFDLIISELFNMDCFLGLIHKFQAPHIAMSSSGLYGHHSQRFGNPDNPSYIPVLAEPSSDKMNFIARLLNTIHYIYNHYLVVYLFDLPSEFFARWHFGLGLPFLQDIARNTSLVLLNTHFSINKAVPLVPGVIEVAGLHLPSVKKLPQDLQEFLDGAENGVIYFSMGSLLNVDSIDDSTRQALSDAFSEIPQRVLWKWGGNIIPEQPKNVKFSKWVPQFDVLNHPKVKLFIGHGGQLGVIEAVHCGVPMIGIPMFGDQHTNVKHIETAGMGIMLEYSQITKDNVLNAIRTVLTNTSYAENARRVSLAFRDRPMSAMDTAVYWTEYVIRHRGAQHLRSAAVDLNIFQYLLIDVLLVLLTVTASVVYVTYRIFRLIIRRLSRRKPIIKKKQSKEKRR